VPELPSRRIRDRAWRRINSRQDLVRQSRNVAIARHASQPDNWVRVENEARHGRIRVGESFCSSGHILPVNDSHRHAQPQLGGNGPDDKSPKTGWLIRRASTELRR
jgi:hypothetical protein